MSISGLTAVAIFCTNKINNKRNATMSVSAVHNARKAKMLQESIAAKMVKTRTGVSCQRTHIPQK
jgi:hypothetical protein